MKIKLNIGILRIAVVRSIFLFSLQTWAMVLVGFISEHGWRLWYAAIPVFFIVWWILDINVVWRQEVDATFMYSREFQELKETVRRMEKTIREMRDEKTYSGGLRNGSGEEIPEIFPKG